MNPQYEGNIVVLPRNRQVADVFVGKGWDNHALFRVYKGQVFQIRGPKFNEPQLKQITAALGI